MKTLSPNWNGSQTVTTNAQQRGKVLYAFYQLNASFGHKKGKGVVITYWRWEGYKTGGGGEQVFYPYKKGWQEKFLAILKGGTTSFGVVLTQVLEVFNHIGGGGTKGFHHLKGFTLS